MIFFFFLVAIRATQCENSSSWNCRTDILIFCIYFHMNGNLDTYNLSNNPIQNSVKVEKINLTFVCEIARNINTPVCFHKENNLLHQSSGLYCSWVFKTSMQCMCLWKIRHQLILYRWHELFQGNINTTQKLSFYSAKSSRF